MYINFYHNNFYHNKLVRLKLISSNFVLNLKAAKFKIWLIELIRYFCNQCFRKFCFLAEFRRRRLMQFLIDFAIHNKYLKIFWKFAINGEWKKVILKWNSCSRPERNISESIADSSGRLESLSRLIVPVWVYLGFIYRTNHGVITRKECCCVFSSFHSQTYRDTAETPLNDYIVRIHANALRGRHVKVILVYT